MCATALFETPGFCGPAGGATGDLLLARMDSVSRLLADIDAEARQIDAQKSQLQDSLNVLNLAVLNHGRYVAKLDSQYRILEAERQPLVNLLSRSVLADLRLGKWAFLDALLGSENLSNFLTRRAAMARLRESTKLRAAESVRELHKIRDFEDISLEEAKKLQDGKSQIEALMLVFEARDMELISKRMQAENERNILLAQQQRIESSNSLLNKQLLERATAFQRVSSLIGTEVNKIDLSGTFASLKGRLPWPVEGSLVNKFGRKRHRMLETVTENPGIDVATKASIPVLAVAPGIVKTVTWLRGFGNICIVQHEGDHHTVYARLGEVLLKQGDIIDRQTIVGYPGFDSEGKKYILHFEVWVGKEKQDPIAWLAPVNQ